MSSIDVPGQSMNGGLQLCINTVPKAWVAWGCMAEAGTHRSPPPPGFVEHHDPT